MTGRNETELDAELPAADIKGAAELTTAALACVCARPAIADVGDEVC